jgi:hypothetical protein
MDIEALKKALDNESNESICNLNSSLIKQIKNDMLQQLQLPRDKLKDMHNKLKYYRYVDDLSNLQYGRFIRWINLKKTDNIFLTNGAHIMDIKIEKTGIQILCRNNMNRFITLNIDEHMIFQKITDQESILISAMDYLNKN